MANVYDFTVRDRSGKDVSLKDYEGKVLLIVNTATGCGFTPHYDPLEAMYRDLRDQGFEILDFPCNQFANQAPESDDEIHEFCTLKFGTEFPQFAKIDVNGDTADPLFSWLASEKPFNGFGMGLDLGAVYEFKDFSLAWLDGMKVSMALTDVGFISYGNKMVAESSGNTFQFDGFNNLAVKKDSPYQSIDDQMDDVEDRLADFANLEVKPEEGGGSTTHGIGATLRMGVEYPLPMYDRLSFGFLYTHRYSDLYAWSEGRLSANYAPAKWLDGGINLGFSSFSTEMGWIINVHPKGLNFFVGMDYMIGKTGKSMIPLDSNVGFNVGINITFNGKKDKRKLETL